jgi:hypothetical protein
MVTVDKKKAECLALVQQANRLASKAAPVFSVMGLLQEAIQLNQQMVAKMVEILEVDTNERAQKGPHADGGEVSGEARQTSS